VPAYHLDGVTELNFTSEALAGIFLGRVTNWSDPVISKANPTASLPDLPIVVVHRSGGRINHVWSDYLDKVNPQWKAAMGPPRDMIVWPTGFGLAAGEEDEISRLVKQTNGSIAFLNYPYVLTQNLSFGKVRNRAGVFVKANSSTLTAAAATPSKETVDSRLSITDPEGRSAYPIANFAWLLVPEKIDDLAKKRALKGFLKWATSDGQNFVDPTGFARLPPAVGVRVNKALAKIR
jgi:phosphate transport system substrate-binding protein